MLLKEIEDEIRMDELEADVKMIMTLFNFWKARAMMIDREQAAVSEQSLHRLKDVSTNSSRLTLKLTAVVSLAP